MSRWHPTWRRCRNCKQHWSAHNERKCLFDVTSWDPMTMEETEAYDEEVAWDDYAKQVRQMYGLEADALITRYLGRPPDLHKPGLISIGVHKVKGSP